MKSQLADTSPSLQRIVERQARRWEIQGRCSPATAVSGIKLHPFITISRLAGSSGEQVAAELSRRLGWKLYDRELLERMSEHETERRNLYSTLDEQKQNWMDGLLAVCAPEMFSARTDFHQALCRTIVKIVQEGPAILVGRGAHLVLPDDLGLRVRVVARLNDRVTTLARERYITLEEARRALRRLDQQRLAFLKQHFGVETDSPEDYDLTVNTSRLPVPQACHVILAALEQRLALREQKV